SLLSGIFCFSSFLSFFKSSSTFAWKFLISIISRHFTCLVQTQDFLFIKCFVLQQGFGNNLMLFTMCFKNFSSAFVIFIDNTFNFLVDSFGSVFRIRRQLTIVTATEWLSILFKLNGTKLVCHTIFSNHSTSNLSSLLKVI